MGGCGHTVRLADLKSGSDLARLGHPGGISALAMLADGRLASNSWDNSIWLWDVNGKELARLEWDATASSLAAWANGHLVVSDQIGRTS